MAPNLHQQTNSIVFCLLDDEANCFETDGPGDDDGFDPVKIAAKLREIGDDYDETRIQPLIRDLKLASGRQQVEAAFGSGVEALCQSWAVSGRSEVASEKELLRASVALGLYVKRNCPDLLGGVQGAMASFVNTRLGSWITAQGGWDNAVSS